VVTLGLLVSIILPVGAGFPWLVGLQRQRQPGNWGIAIGYGYLVGILAICAGLYLAGYANLPLNLLAAISLPLIIGVLGWARFGRTVATHLRHDLSAVRRTRIVLPRATTIVVTIAVALIVARFSTLAIDTLSRPLFAWEAVSAIAAKARVWWEFQRLVPFVGPAAMFDSANAYTSADPRSSALPSLLLVWNALAMGQWHEGGVGFSWWMLGVALAAAFYGHLRKVGCGVAYASVFTYALISLPLVDVHMSLSGVSQWPAAVGVGLAGCALLRALGGNTRDAWICATIAMLFALASLASTWPWLIIFALAAVISAYPRHANKLAIGAPLAVAIALLAWMQSPVKIAGLSLRVQLATDWTDAPESLLLLDNWHLLFVILLVVAVAGRRHMLTGPWKARTFVVAMAVGLMVVKGFLALQPWWLGGLRDFSYAGLQAAPVLMLWLAWLAREVAGSKSVEPSGEYESVRESSAKT